MTWYGLPPRTYYYPIVLDYYYGSAGTYTININGVACPPAPPNDNCQDVIQGELPFTAFGTTQGATNDCFVLDYPQVWEAFTISDCMDVKIDLCGTQPAFYYAYAVLMTGCACENWITANSSDYHSCPDGNLSMIWNSLSPGTYYYPVFSDPYYGTTGPYTLNISGLPCPVPCLATGGCFEHISQFQVGSIDNTSACSGYADYMADTGLSTNFYIGKNYPFSITNSVTYYADDQCGVWVDWNQDDDFFDLGEQASVVGTPGTGPYTVVITPPDSAPPGETRMRIRISWSDFLLPCGQTNFGEVEDYKVIVATPTQSGTIRPYPQYTYCQFAINPITDTVYVGNFASGHVAENVDLSSITINGTAPTSTTVISLDPRFVAGVVRLTLPLSGLVKPYGTIYGVVSRDFKVAGKFVDATAFTIHGNVTLVGVEPLNPSRYIAPPDYIDLPGDIDLSGLLDISDPVALVGYIFNGDPGPSIILVGDTDCSGGVDISDAVGLIAYIFTGGAPPCVAGTWRHRGYCLTEGAADRYPPLPRHFSSSNTTEEKAHHPMILLL